MKKAVLITGASSGIGAETARLFAENGYFVFLLARNKDKLAEVAENCRSGASLLGCDLADTALINKAIKHLYERPDVDLEIVINNAGIYEPQDHTSSLETWKRQFQVNLFGAVELTQGLLPLLKKRGGGSIVNISSTLGLKPSGGVAAYCASKAAMNSWTQSLAIELAKDKIRVNAVCPGIVDTPIHGGKDLSNWGHLQPLGRVGSSREIAESIYFLGSEKSAWTTGALLSVDGGINLL